MDTTGSLELDNEVVNSSITLLERKVKLNNSCKIISKRSKKVFSDKYLSIQCIPYRMKSKPYYLAIGELERVEAIGRKCEF
jgi:hypothetical protein